MKVITNFFKGILISLWVVLAILTTVCLIAWNDKGVSEFGDYSLFIMDNNSLKPTFNKNDIVILHKDLEIAYDAGDKVFFYKGNRDTKSYINFGEIIETRRNDNAEDSFYFDANTEVSYGDILGKVNGALVVKKLGIVLKIMESRWGFMFLVILPTIYAIAYEVYSIVVEVKKSNKSASKKTKKNSDDD